MHSYADLLYGLRGLFQATPGLSRNAFDNYVYSLDLPLHFPGVRAISYATRVSAAELKKFERRLQTDPALIRRGVRDVSIYPPAERPEYFVVKYIEPLHNHKAALGFDLASDPRRMAMIERARDSGMPTLSGRLILASDPSHSEAAVVMRLALYRKNAFTPDMERRREAFIGLANVTFTVEDWAHQLLAGLAYDNIRMSIHDVGYVGATPKPTPQALYANVAQDDALAGAMFEESDYIDVGQRRWELKLSVPREQFLREFDRALPWAAMTAVLAASVLLSGLIRSLGSAREDARDLAEQMTADLRQSQATLAEEKRRTQALIEALPNPIYFKGTDGRYLGVNKAWETYFGRERQNFLGKTVHDLYPDDPEIAQRLHADDQAAWSSPDGHSYETVITSADGNPRNAVYYKAPYANADGSVAGLIGTIVDITDRKQAEEHIRHLAQYDTLTGLANRNMFYEHLKRALIQAQRIDKPLAVMFMDLDRFKNINDTLGHSAGDTVLKEVAERLRAALRAGDIIGRLGGDEFVVLLEELPEPMHCAAAAKKIVDTVARAYILDGQEFHVTASIGISTYPADGEDMQSLLKNADIAMYRAKELGKNNYQFYSEQMNVHSVERLALESGLRRALERDEFVLHYQPRVDIGSGRITGMEALVRWQHPSNGLIPPLQFIPLAEETGLIVDIGAWVLRAACAQNQAWRDQGLPPLRVAVNLSARQFAHEHLLRDVERVLRETELDPTALELEITESVVVQDPERAVTLLRALKAMGVYISIDDFGTGYSSLSYLKRFPIDSMKIDRSFIKDLPLDQDDTVITQAIIAMTHGLKLVAVAEGVETGEQLAFLRDHGCDEMQGFHFSKPLPAEQFAQLVLNRNESSDPITTLSTRA